MALKFSNNASATLAASITSTSTSITVTTGQGALFPALSAGDYFYATLFNSSNNIEIIKVTARSSDTMTAVRGQDGTTARAYAAADKLELRLVSAALNDFVSEDGNNTLTGTNTFNGNISSSGTNTFTGTNNFTGPVGFTTIPTFNGGALPVANGGTGSTTSTGTGSVVLATSPKLTTPTLTTPALNTPNLSVPTNVTYGKIETLFETATITASAPAATTNFDLATQAVQYYTSNATTNFTLNFRANAAGTATVAGSFIVGATYTIVSAGTTDFTAIGAPNNTVGTVFAATGVGSGTGTATTTGTLNSILAVGQSVSCTLIVTNGAPSTVTAGSFVVGAKYTIVSLGTTDFTAIGAASNTVGVTFTATGAGSGTGTAATVPYYPTAFQVDGVSVTPKWQLGYAPVSGDASSLNVYTFAIVKTASATYTVLASQLKYA